ncbi:hypothetical protein ES703_38571 [subsurface metagenome]
MNSVKRDTTRPVQIKVSSPIVVKLTWLAAFLFTLAGGMFATYRIGYEAAWGKIENVYTDAVLLEAKADELEERIIQLGNSQAYMAAVLSQAGIPVPTIVRIAPDTIICTLQVSTPVQAGKKDKR